MCEKWRRFLSNINTRLKTKIFCVRAKSSSAYMGFHGDVRKQIHATTHSQNVSKIIKASMVSLQNSPNLCNYSYDYVKRNINWFVWWDSLYSRCSNVPFFHMIHFHLLGFPFWFIIPFSQNNGFVIITLAYATHIVYTICLYKLFHQKISILMCLKFLRSN